MFKVICPVEKVTDKQTHLVIVRTKYATIEKVCSSRVEANIYLKEMLDQNEVVSYSIQ